MRKESTPSTMAQVGRHAGYGITIAASAALFAWVGTLLDDRLGTRPLFVILGAFLGFGAGFYNMYRHLVLESSKERDEDKPAE